MKKNQAFLGLSFLAGVGMGGLMPRSGGFQGEVSPKVAESREVGAPSAPTALPEVDSGTIASPSVSLAVPRDVGETMSPVTPSMEAERNSGLRSLEDRLRLMGLDEEARQVRGLFE